MVEALCHRALVGSGEEEEHTHSGFEGGMWRFIIIIRLKGCSCVNGCPLRRKHANNSDFMADVGLIRPALLCCCTAVQAA